MLTAFDENGASHPNGDGCLQVEHGDAEAVEQLARVLETVTLVYQAQLGSGVVGVLLIVNTVAPEVEKRL